MITKWRKLSSDIGDAREEPRDSNLPQSDSEDRESETAPLPKSKWRKAERTQHGYGDREKDNDDLDKIKRTERE